MIATGLFTLLSNNAGVSALVATRVYPLSLPQNAVFPCISYEFEEQQEQSDYDGQGDFGDVEIQINNWADEYDDALSLAAAVKTALKNFTGNLDGEYVYRLILNTSVTVIEDAVGKYRTTQIYTLTR